MAGYATYLQRLSPSPIDREIQIKLFFFFAAAVRVTMPNGLTTYIIMENARCCPSIMKRILFISHNMYSHFVMNGYFLASFELQMHFPRFDVIFFSSKQRYTYNNRTPRQSEQYKYSSAGIGFAIKIVWFKRRNEWFFQRIRDSVKRLNHLSVK